MTSSTKEVTGMASYQEIEQAVAVLQSGGLLLYPADTLWSIGCDATDPVAVERICNLRENRSTSEFEILVSSIDMMRHYVDHLHPKLETLLAYHVRPLTVQFERGRNLPDRLIDPDGAVAVRLAQAPFCRALIKTYGRPLIAVQASREGQTIPASFGAVSSSIIGGVDYVLQPHQKNGITGEPAVMVRLSKRGELEFLRE